jgi:NhaP-type Na+/H+ or K+/H+ antiporter
MEAELAILALLVASYGLIAARLDRWSIGPSLFFLAIGMLLSGDALGWVSIEPTAESVKVLAELTLTLLLFADASTIRAATLRPDVATVARLLGVGLLLTILLGTAGALLLFPGISLGLALLIGSILAPTDAALGQAVVTNTAVPARIRRVLCVESGLNDGIATPFVLFALALAATEASGSSSWLHDALAEVGIGIVIGVVLGLGGGLLLLVADQRRWTSPVSRRLLVLALAAGCYLVAVSTGGNGFIAAFVGGLAFGVGTRQEAESAVRFTETQGSLLAIGVWCAFGLSVAGNLVTRFWDPTAVVYAVLSLTVIRMVPVAIAVIGERYQPLTVLFIGWFGPRGLASIVFLVIALSGLEEAGVAAGPLTAVVVWTVLLSVLLHGLTAGPFAARYGRRMAALAPGAPELTEAAEPRVPRTSWAGREHA